MLKVNEKYCARKFNQHRQKWIKIFNVKYWR